MTSPRTSADSIEIAPVAGPIRARVRPPGSKSITNRALILAALADGASQLIGVLDSQDTRVMVESLGRLGIDVRHDREERTAEVIGGLPTASSAELWLENSGTSIRFLTALAALGRGTYRLDGNARMRQRPIRDLCTALEPLGCRVRCEPSGCPPVVVEADGLRGGRAVISAGLSSQYLSALLMVAPRLQTVELQLDGPLVSEPYIDMTIRMMRDFGAGVNIRQGVYRVEPGLYRGREFVIEPDASAASYFFAAAAIAGGEVTVDGLSRESLQGDVGFVEVLAQMGCDVEWGADSITVRGGKLRGVNVDMNGISDTAQTLAAVALFADGPTRARNIAHVRHKETDRIRAVVTELRRLGVAAEEHDDGFTVHPGPIRPATVETYDDHRMAMSFALVGLKVPDIRIADPGCTAKTYPQFFDDLQTACAAPS